jgi:hypothetical protein
LAISRNESAPKAFARGGKRTPLVCSTTGEVMIGKRWSESSNRRLRTLLLKGRPVAEVALFLDCSTTEVVRQMRRLGVAGASDASPVS